jgi:hypothetical protein
VDIPAGAKILRGGGILEVAANEDDSKKHVPLPIYSFCGRVTLNKKTTIEPVSVSEMIGGIFLFSFPGTLLQAAYPQRQTD